MSARLLDQLQQLRRRRSGSSSNGDSPPQRPPIDPSTSRVKRALFGPVDHEENLRFVRRELARGRQEASHRWNYDFENDRPLKGGRYEWEEAENRAAADSLGEKKQAVADRVEEVPRATETGTTGRVLTDRRGSVDDPACDSENQASSSSSTAMPAAVATGTKPKSAVQSSTPSSSSSTSQRQTSITDHFGHRKRSRSKVKTQDRRPDSQDEHGLPDNPVGLGGESVTNPVGLGEAKPDAAT